MPTWTDRRLLARKFTQHRRDFARRPPFRPLVDIAEYEQGSLDTVRDGIRFTYTDRQRGRPRVGYFDPLTHLFVAVSADDQSIISHFPADDEYVRSLPNSDYP